MPSKRGLAMLDKLNEYHVNADRAWRYINAKYNWMAIYNDKLYLFEDTPLPTENGWVGKGVCASDVIVFDVPHDVDWRLTSYPRHQDVQASGVYVKQMRRLFDVLDETILYLAVNSDGSLVAIRNLDGIFPSLSRWARTNKRGMMDVVPHITVKLPDGMSWRQSLVQR